jgi:DNA-binding transcriptional ArsR family regulator
MNLKDEVRERFMTDTRSILEGHLDDLEGMFQFHEDNSLEVLGEYRDLPPQLQVLIHLIARRYQSEADIVDSPALTNSALYRSFPGRDKSTVRGYLMKLREDGLARKREEGNEMVVERLPEAIEKIEKATGE